MIAETLAIVSSFFIGFNTILVKKSIVKTNATTAMLMVTLAGTIIFWIISLAFIPFYFLKSKALFFFIVAGVFSPALVRWLYYVSLDRIGASISSSILATGPAFAALMALILLDERPTVEIWLGIFLIITGIVLLEREISLNENQTKNRKRKDLIIPLLAAISFGCAIVFRKMGLNILNSPILGVTAGFTTSLFIYLITLAFFKRFRDSLSFDRSDLSLFIIAGFSLAIGWLSIFYALSYGNVSIVAPLTNLHPLFVLVLSYLFIGDIERITPRIVIGALTVVLGVIMITF
ncbi:MAG: DMT family transporter [Candidatus Hydrothermarchaeota archaeon]